MEVFETIGCLICGAMLYMIATLLFGEIATNVLEEEYDGTGWGPWIAGCMMFVVIFVLWWDR